MAHALNAKSTQRLDASVETFVQTAPTLKAGYVAKGARGSRNYGTDADTASSLVAYGIRSDAQREGVVRTPSPDASGLVRLRDPGLGITEGLAPTLDTAGVHAVAFLHMNKGRPDGRQSAHEEMVTAKDHVPTITTGGAPGAVVIPFDETQITHGENRSRCDPGSPSPALARTARPPTIAFNLFPGKPPEAEVRARETDKSDCLSATAGAAQTDRGTRIVQSGVRRLTPTECERLMGFPDGYTALPAAADGPRYAALGNSIAVPVLAWIFKRIDKVHKMRKP